MFMALKMNSKFKFFALGWQNCDLSSSNPPCDINASLIREVMRINNMITQDEFP